MSWVCKSKKAPGYVSPGWVCNTFNRDRAKTCKHCGANKPT